MNFETVALHRISPNTVGFFTPLFVCERSNMLHLQVFNRSHVIEEFVNAEPNLHRVCELKNRISRKVGEEVLFGFTRTNGDHLLGTRNEIAPALKQEVAKLEDSYLKSDIDFFLSSSFSEKHHATTARTIKNGLETINSTTKAREKLGRYRTYNIIEGLNDIPIPFLTRYSSYPFFYLNINERFLDRKVAARFISNAVKDFSTVVPKKVMAQFNWVKFEAPSTKSISNFSEERPMLFGEAVILAFLIYKNYVHTHRNSIFMEQFIRIEPCLYYIDGVNNLASPANTLLVNNALRKNNNISNEDSEIIKDLLNGCIATKSVAKRMLKMFLSFQQIKWSHRPTIKLINDKFRSHNGRFDLVKSQKTDWD